MDVRTYRARSMQEALRLIRLDLGPDAAVLHTREISAGVLGSMFGGRQIEVTASTEVKVPSRLPESSRREAKPMAPAEVRVAAEFRQRAREHVARDFSHETELGQESVASQGTVFFHLFTDLLDAGATEKVARELLETVKRRLNPRECRDSLVVKANLATLIEADLRVLGAIRLVSGRRTIAAFVGPTGVGKTTTIAKIAANFRLQEKARVGLITVDTYRIAAVEQLRTYAEIIDLPMEVVATPREMRSAVERFNGMDLVLIDTAGRSPRDAAQIQELRSLLAEAQADEVHLTLSSVTATEAHSRAIERFREVGATHITLTKIDEAAGLGALLPIFRSQDLPLAYLTHGQMVPHDIRPAERRAFARMLLGWDSLAQIG